MLSLVRRPPQTASLSYHGQAIKSGKAFCWNVLPELAEMVSSCNGPASATSRSIAVLLAVALLGIPFGYLNVEASPG